MIRLWIVMYLTSSFLLSGCKLEVVIGGDRGKQAVKFLTDNVVFYQEPTSKLCFMASITAVGYPFTNVPCEAAMKSPKFIKVEK